MVGLFAKCHCSTAPRLCAVVCRSYCADLSKRWVTLLCGGSCGCMVWFIPLVLVYPEVEAFIRAHGWLLYRRAIVNGWYLGQLAHDPRDAYGDYWLLWMLVLVTTATDVGGFFSGRALGRRKLAPALSPERPGRERLAACCWHWEFVLRHC